MQPRSILTWPMRAARVRRCRSAGGGPGITRSDLLVINKTDLAPYVGASLHVMQHNTERMRGARPFVFTNLRAGEGLDTISDFIVREGMLR